MGQVPANKTNSPNIGIIGRGRAAKHLSFYFESMGYALRKWDRSQPIENLKPLSDCAVVFLAVPDSQVDEFIFNNSFLLKSEIVHLSGSLKTTIRGLHPLASFGSNLFDMNTYKQIAFVTEFENPFNFKKHFPNLPNPFLVVPREMKAKYHAYCVAANNFTTMLWQKYFETLQNEFGIPFEAARGLFRSTFININNDWQKALTGPLVRGDAETIAKNLEALQGDSLQKIYHAFVELHQSGRKENIQYVYLEPGEIGL